MVPSTRQCCLNALAMAPRELPALNHRQRLTLAVLDEGGRWPSELVGGIGVGALFELFQAGRLEMVGQEVSVRDSTPTGDADLDGAVSRIEASRKPRTVGHWALSGLTTLKLFSHSFEQLVDCGLVESRRWRLGRRYPAVEAHAPAVAAWQERVRTAAAGDGPVEGDAAIAAMLIAGSGMTDRIVAEKRDRMPTKVIASVAERAELPEQQLTLVRDVADAVWAAVTESRRAQSAILPG